MNKKVKPFLIVGVFWLALFFFVMAGYSGSFGSITGFAVKDAVSTSDAGVGMQSVAILVLFFTNIVTMFFLVREMANK